MTVIMQKFTLQTNVQSLRLVIYSDIQQIALRVNIEDKKLSNI